MSKQAVAVVLAAGKGTRMNSALPKVLCPVMGRPMIEFVLDARAEAGIERQIVVVGYEADRVRDALADRDQVDFALQAQQLGTGHAVMMCRELLETADGPVVVVAGDSPMLQPSSVRRLLDEFETRRPGCILGTLIHDNPTGLGRIVRDQAGEFVGIVEEKDATPEQKQIREVNMSTYVFDCQPLLSALSRLSNDNRQGEYYITDVPGLLRDDGLDIVALPVLQPVEALSINTPEQLAYVETVMKRGI